MMKKIVTNHVYPPIPVRTSDWCAHFDGEEEAGGYGWGRTEQEAIDDFVANLEELPCKNIDKRCAADGSCLRCSADQGEICDHGQFGVGA